MPEIQNLWLNNRQLNSLRTVGDARARSSRKPEIALIAQRFVGSIVSVRTPVNLRGAVPHKLRCRVAFDGSIYRKATHKREVMKSVSWLSLSSLVLRVIP
jgi:hypothetical protein